MELRHVLIADDGWHREDRGEDERRLFCVGMTRARETATFGVLTGNGNPWVHEIEAVKIVALMRRRREDGDPAFRDHCRAETWEAPLVEVCVRR
jgi:hypothetical protein